MAHVLEVEQLKRRMANRPPQYLFIHPTWFEEEAAGIRQPKHPGETMAEFRERKARRRRACQIAVAVLLMVSLAVGLWML